MRKVETTRQKMVKRLRQIANAEGITYAEVQKIFESQFKFTKQTIEELDSEYLENASEEELKKHVFNFIYLGKVHTGKRLQTLTKKRKEKKNGRDKNERDTNQ